MHIQEEKKDDYIILKLTGRIDSTNSLEFEKKILGLFTENTNKLIIDCTELDYISSSGLRVFLMAMKKIKSIQGSLAICSMQDQIKEVFDISGFTGIFSIYDTQQEAVENI
jgi:anti-anti-sigma factor